MCAGVWECSVRSGHTVHSVSSIITMQCTHEMKVSRYKFKADIYYNFIPRLNSILGRFHVNEEGSFGAWL